MGQATHSPGDVDARDKPGHDGEPRWFIISEHALSPADRIFLVRVDADMRPQTERIIGDIRAASDGHTLKPVFFAY